MRRTRHRWDRRHKKLTLKDVKDSITKLDLVVMLVGLIVLVVCLILF